MRRKTGILIIFLCMLVTSICWYIVSQNSSSLGTKQISELIAALALVAFALVNFISTRHRVVDNLFNGLDKSYIYHKYLSIAALLMVIVHNFTIKGGKGDFKKFSNAAFEAGRKNFERGGESLSHLGKTFGSLSLYLFIALIIIAIIAKKLNYERWKLIHKFMIVAYAFGIYHYYANSTYSPLSISIFSIWMDIMNFIGIISAVYSVLFYELAAFRYKFRIEKLQYVGTGALEITGVPISRGINFKPGQFAFLKIKGDKNKFTSHPFTISSAPGVEKIQFTIKALGDHTRVLADTLKVGDKFAVAGPHGKFNYKEGSKRQVWIAGGIGITPFRSFLESGVEKDYSIDFFYAYNNEEEGFYVEELKKANSSNVRLHLLNSKKQGFLTVDEISKQVNSEEAIDVYFCGPKPMRDTLKKQFKESNLRIKKFHYENFQFR